jgi:L-threonylcarbamoyladenylate synthase
MEELGDRISLIVDGGPSEVGVESTVVAVDTDKIWLLRPGKIGSAELERTLNVPVVRATSVHEKASPGMLESHYAPRKPMYIVSDWNHPLPSSLAEKKSLQIGLMISNGTGETAQKTLESSGWNVKEMRLLCDNNDSESAAKKLFATMRELDHSDIDIILTNKILNSDGLWPAIADRIFRASNKISQT